MPKSFRFLPETLVAVAAAAMLAHGPIPQLPHYHEFADRRSWLGIPNAADVLSNVPFAIVAAWAWVRLRRASTRASLGAAWDGYAAFAAALALTALGSACYHWAPDNARLVWDRLPIALACAALIQAVHAQTHPREARRWQLAALAGFAVASVAWWAWTEARGLGDLRPYLLLQAAPIVLVPLWQAQARTPRATRIAFGAALALYAVAKAAELADHAILDATGLVSGHTLKHLVAALAAAVIVGAATRGEGFRSPRAFPAPPRGWSGSRRSP
jgi:hypothetical protein